MNMKGLTVIKLYICAYIVNDVNCRSVSRKTKPNRGDNEIWLDDLDGGNLGVYMGDLMLGDGPKGGGGGKSMWSSETLSCPAPRPKISKKECSAKKCKSDTECHIDGMRCCYNGCVYTCLSSLPPPKLIDWIVKPTGKSKSDGAWLLDGEDDEQSHKQHYESCSTDNIIEGADPLLCPHGYLCHIDQPGDPKKNIPNTGKCVPLKSNIKESHRKYLFNKTKGKKGTCVFKKKIIKNGGTTAYNRHPCVCKSGSLICSVGVNI